MRLPTGWAVLVVAFSTAATASAQGLRSVDQLLDKPVVNAEGQTIGRAIDLLLNAEQNAVEALVVTTDGRQVRLTTDQWRVSSGAGGNAFRIAADLDDPFAPAAALSETAAPRVRRVSRMLGTDLRDRSFNRIGELTDLVIDGERRIVFAVAETRSGLFGMKRERSVVPWSVVYIHDRPLRLVVDATRDDVDEVTFAPTATPYLTDQAFIQRALRHYEQDAAPTYAFVGEMQPAPQDRTAWNSPLAAADDAMEPPPTQIVEGHIQAMREFRTGRNDIHGGTEMLLRTNDGRSFTVIVLSNLPLRANQVATLELNQQVTVVGSRSTVEQRNYLLASSIVTEDGAIRLVPAGETGIDGLPGPLRRVGPVDAFPNRNLKIVPGSINSPGGPIPQIELLPEP